MLMTALPQGIEKWHNSSKVAGVAACTANSRGRFVKHAAGPVCRTRNSFFYLKSGHVKTNKGPDVMCTSFRLSVCTAADMLSRLQPCEPQQVECLRAQTSNLLKHAFGSQPVKQSDPNVCPDYR